MEIHPKAEPLGTMHFWWLLSETHCLLHERFQVSKCAGVAPDLKLRRLRCHPGGEWMPSDSMNDQKPQKNPLLSPTSMREGTPRLLWESIKPPHVWALCADSGGSFQVYTHLLTKCNFTVSWKCKNIGDFLKKFFNWAQEKANNHPFQALN